MINKVLPNSTGTSKQIYFSENTEKPQKNSKTIENSESNSSSKTAKYMIGASAIAATAIGILLLKKYKNPTSLSIQKFKGIGYFDKGKAFINGKAYSGKITLPLKNNETRIIEYSNGVVQNSVRKSKDLGVLSNKEYFYYDNGKLKEIKSDSKQTSFTNNGSIKSVNHKGEIISEVKVKADETLPYDANKSFMKKNKYSDIDYIYMKEGKKIIKENISTNEEYKSILTKNLLTGERVNKRIFNDGSFDILKEGCWVDKGSWSTGKVEHFDCRGNYIGYSECISSTENFHGPDPFSMRGSGHTTKYQFRKYNANHKLIDYDTHTETYNWEPPSMEYFGY